MAGLSYFIKNRLSILPFLPFIGAAGFRMEQTVQPSRNINAPKIAILYWKIEFCY